MKGTMTCDIIGPEVARLTSPGIPRPHTAGVQHHPETVIALILIAADRSPYLKQSGIKAEASGRMGRDPLSRGPTFESRCLSCLSSHSSILIACLACFLVQAQPPDSGALTWGHAHELVPIGSAVQAYAA